jgi:hypothetical protein
MFHSRHRGNFYEEIIAPAGGRACSWTRCPDKRRHSMQIVAAGLFGFVVFHDVTQLDLTGPLPRALATFR